MGNLRETHEVLPVHQHWCYIKPHYLWVLVWILLISPIRQKTESDFYWLVSHLREGGACWAAGRGGVFTDGIWRCVGHHQWRSDGKHDQYSPQLWNQRGTKSANAVRSLSHTSFQFICLSTQKSNQTLFHHLKSVIYYCSCQYDQESFVLIDSKLVTLFRFLLNTAAFCQPASRCLIHLVLFTVSSVRCCWPWRSPESRRSHPSWFFRSLSWASTPKSGSMTCVPQLTSTRSQWSAWSSKVRAPQHTWAIITLPLCVKADDDQLLLLHPAVFSFVSQLIPGRPEAADQTETCAAAVSMTWFFWFLLVSDSSGEPLCLISSSVESGAELLKVQYCKVMTSLSHFSTDNLFRW